MNKTKCVVLILMVVSGLLAVPVLPAQEKVEALTLQRAVALAVQNSRELALARVQLDVAERTVGLNRSLFLPNFYTGSGAAYSSGFPLDAPTVFNLSYVQTLFNSPLRGELRASRERAEGRRRGMDRVRDAVILRAASAYLELAKVRHSLELLRRERSSAEKIVAITRQRAAEGLELPVEVTRAELSGARVAQRVVRFEGREETLENELRGLMNWPAEQPLALVEVSASPTQGVHTFSTSASADELVAQALANNPDLQAAESERRARDQRFKGERGGYWPTVDLVARYGVFSRFNNYDDFYRKFERHNVNLGVQVRIPLFSARTSAAVELARSELSAAELELEKKRRDLETDVRRQARLQRELEAAREVARLELALAQEDLRVLQARFDQGRASLRDLEKARLDEHDKWMAFLDADFTRQKAQLELLGATGQLARVFP